MNSQPGVAAEKIIVALDVPTLTDAVRLAEKLRAHISTFKIGLQLYTAEGPDVVRAILATGTQVFLDLKLHDIPNTIARAVESANKLGVQMLTIHLSGGRAMIEAAVAARNESLTYWSFGAYQYGPGDAARNGCRNRAGSARAEIGAAWRHCRSQRAGRQSTGSEEAPGHSQPAN